MDDLVSIVAFPTSLSKADFNFELAEVSCIGGVNRCFERSAPLKLSLSSTYHLINIPMQPTHVQALDAVILQSFDNQEIDLDINIKLGVADDDEIKRLPPATVDDVVICRSFKPSRNSRSLRYRIPESLRVVRIIDVIIYCGWKKVGAELTIKPRTISLKILNFFELTQELAKMTIRETRAPLSAAIILCLRGWFIDVPHRECLNGSALQAKSEKLGRLREIVKQIQR